MKNFGPKNFELETPGQSLSLQFVPLCTCVKGTVFITFRQFCCNALYLTVMSNA